MSTLLALSDAAVAWMKGIGMFFFLAVWVAIALRLLRRSDRWQAAARIPLDDELPRSPRHGHG